MSKLDTKTRESAISGLPHPKTQAYVKAKTVKSVMRSLVISQSTTPSFLYGEAKAKMASRTRQSSVKVLSESLAQEHKPRRDPRYDCMGCLWTTYRAETSHGKTVSQTRQSSAEVLWKSLAQQHKPRRDPKQDGGCL